MKDALNEYLQDAAEAPYRDKALNIRLLTGSKIAVIGYDNGFSRLVMNMLSYGNDTYKLMLQTEFLNMEECSAAVSEKNWDYVIFTGFSNMHIKEKCHAEQAENIIQWISGLRNLKRFLYLSDYRVYESCEDNMHLAEHERVYGKADKTGGVLRRLEIVTEYEMKQAEKHYVILRLAPAYGPFTDFRNGLHTLAEMIAEGREAKLNFSQKEMSYIYINDILRGIMQGILMERTDTIYNLSSGEAPYNIEEMVSRLRKEFPEQCRISFSYKSAPDSSGTDKPENEETAEALDFRNYAVMSGSKMKLAGWESKVPFIDGMIILIKSIRNTGEVFIFDNSYQGKLMTVHQILLGYLLMIDRICKKHGIKYFLGGGTLLGAIRHKGFIPWDDDADVMLLRPDYDRLVQVLKEELPANMFFQVPETDALNHQPFIKIRLDDTVFATKFTANFPDMHNGIFIDILAHDRTAKSIKGQKMHLFQTLLSRSLVFNKWGNTPITLGGSHPFLCKIATFMKNILPMKFLEKRMFHTLQKYKKKETGYLYDGMGRNLRRGAFPEEWLESAVLWDFEGYRLPVPKEYDKYLTWLYGDYMKMIPVSERRTSHSIVWMDLGKYSDFKVKTDLTLENN